MSSPGQGSGGQRTAGEDAQQSLFERLFGALLGGEDEERLRKRQLKNIAKALKKSRFKFYKPRGEEVQPALAKFFHDIYRTVGPAQTLLSNAESSTALRGIVIDSYLSDSQREQRDALDEERIREQARVKGTGELRDYLKEAILGFYRAFDNQTVKEINATYSNIRRLVNFVRFDYYFLLRKFDSSFPEGEFTYKPKFDSLQVEYISDDLKDFLEIAYPLDKQANWDAVFDALRAYKGVETIARSEWKKLVAQVEDVLKSNVLTMIIQHADKDPSFQPSSRKVSERIVEPYLESLKTRAESTVQSLMHERRTEKADQLKQKVFGSTAISRTKYYTDTANLVFTKRNLAGYAYTEPLNYLKAFLLDYVKKDVREVVRDILIVRGQWSDNITSQRMSEAFHQVFTIADQVVRFDDSLAEEGELGQKVKRGMGRIKDRDPGTTKLLKQTLDEVNKQARAMIMDSAQALITMARDLKTLIEDYDKKSGELLLNWKELDSYTEEPLKDRMVEIYRTTYYFVQLLQMYVKKQQSSGDGGE
ncbi:MAG: hypothetical protein GVY14_13200 [Spirochaetes bacterium]|jgi:hypothetical protein|nr:hypothetical protein [Spirochaetota bacterium]